MRHVRASSGLVGMLSLAIVVCVFVLTPRLVTAQEIKKFTLVNVLIGKTKVWLPSNIVLFEGDNVALTLDNTLTAPHGFKLSAYGIEVEVPSLKKKTVTFQAKTVGAHAYVCHLHPPHVGGQIVVLKK